MSSNNEAKTLTETAREWTEELRRREAERYETLLRERLRSVIRIRVRNKNARSKLGCKRSWSVMEQRLARETGQRCRHCDGSRSSCVCALQPGIRIYRQINPKGSRSGLLKP